MSVLTCDGLSMMADNVLSKWTVGNAPRGEDMTPTDPGLKRGLSVIICTYQRALSLDRFLDSLALQDHRPDNVIIVDASPNEDSEIRIRARRDIDALGGTICYYRVSGPLKGLTRQRNFGLRRVATDLVAFFDDDIVLRPNCLGVMEHVHRTLGESVVGVGAYLEGGRGRPTSLWRVRRALRMVSNLLPGTYQRSGMSVPWGFMPVSEETVDGDYLPGGATMWKTSILRELSFDESFEGYGQGEDLEFSLRARRKGRLVLCGAARLQHLHDETGRPDYFRLGYMAIYNRFQIHRRGLDDRSGRDVAWFVYTWGLDTLMLMRHLVIPARFGSVLKQVAGRSKAAFDLLSGK
jgi:GT2 family glycosyltransferase